MFFVNAESIGNETNYTVHAPIIINSNADFTIGNGVTSGDGTEGNPWIIEDWEITGFNIFGIFIGNTTDYFIIQNCYIHNCSEFAGNIAFPYPSLSSPVAILTYNITNGILFDNKIAYNYYSLLLYESFNNTLTSNQIITTPYPLIIEENSNRNLITNNTIVGDMSIREFDSNYNTYTQNYFEIGWTEFGNCSWTVVDNNTFSDDVFDDIYFYDSDNITIRNCVIDISPDWCAIDCYDSEYITIENCSMTGNEWGAIYLDNCPNSIIQYNEMFENGDEEYLTASVHLDNSDDCLIWNNNISLGNQFSSYFNGITLIESDRTMILENNIYENQYGISIENSEDTEILNNIIANNFYNIRIDIGNGTTIYNNNLSYGYESNVCIYNANNVIVENNNISFCEAGYGFEIYDAINPEITLNNISNCYLDGALIDDTVTNGIIKQNTFFNNRWFGLSSYGDTSLFYLNRFDGNLVGNADEHGDSDWDNGSYGNYWYNWTTPDVNDDGIVDNPYISDGIIDNYPLIWNWTATNNLIANAGNDTTIEINNTVTFNASESVGIITNYTWSFEYNETTYYLYGEIVNFTFEYEGEYLVTLNITDGVTYSTDTITVYVNDIVVPNQLLIFVLSLFPLILLILILKLLKDMLKQQKKKK